LFSFVTQDLVHPPLFYVLLKVWIAAGGESLFWLRLLPALIAFVSIIPFLLICRELKLRGSTTLLAFLLFAVNSSLIKNSQEVRMYSLLLCLALFSVWLFLRWQRDDKGIIALAVVNVLLVYAHYAGWLVVGTEFLLLLLFRRELLKRFYIVIAISIVAFVPWLIAIWNTAGANEGLEQNIGWMERPAFMALFQLVLNGLEPFYTPPTSIDPVSIYEVTIPVLLIVLTAIPAWLLQNKRDDSNRQLPTLLMFAFVPGIAVLFASWILPYSIWGTRHLIILFPFFLILTALVITQLKNDW